MVKKEYSSPQILATFCLWVLFIDAQKHNVSVFEKKYGIQSAGRRRVILRFLSI